MYIIYFFPITSMCVFAATFPWKYINSQHRHVLSTWPARPVGQPGPFSLMILVHQVGSLVLRKTNGFWPSNMGGNPCTTWKIYKEPYVFFCHTSNVDFCGGQNPSTSVGIHMNLLLMILLLDVFIPPKTQYTNWVWTIPRVFHQFCYNSWLVVSTPLKILVSWDYYSQYMEK